MSVGGVAGAGAGAGAGLASGLVFGMANGAGNGMAGSLGANGMRTSLPSGLEGTQRVPSFDRPTAPIPELPTSAAAPSLSRGLTNLDLPFGRTRILVYDGDLSTRGTTLESFAGGPYELVQCRTPGEISYLLKSAAPAAPAFDLLLWGLTAPYEIGLTALKELRFAYPNMKMALMASQEALAHAPLIKSANLDALILKPLHPQDLRASVDRVLRKARPLVTPLAEPAIGLPTPAVEPLAEAAKAPATSQMQSQMLEDLGMIGSSAEMLKIFTLVRKVAPTSVNVMITGESGSGKEMISQAIHRASDRAQKPFITINCASIPRDLLESELFGHAKGAFPGAATSRRGLFEEAHEGTILLDEVGDLPLPLQAKVLRLIQTRQLKAMGQTQSREIDVRIISTTQKNLKTMIQKGEFREDLYYRLNVMPVHLPALRERKEDIVMLAEHFLRACSTRSGRASVPQLSKKAGAKILGMPWKGNVRELENVIERAIVLCDGVTINENEIVTEEAEPAHATAEDLFNSGLSLKDIEREYIKYVLGRTGNRKEAATRILGIDRKTLYRKEKIYGIRQSEALN